MDNNAITPDIFYGLETELKLSVCYQRTPLFCLSLLVLLALLWEATHRSGAMGFFQLEIVFSCAVIFCSFDAFHCICSITEV